MTRSGILGLCVLLCHLTFSQKITIEKVEPPFWWSGMKNSELQLLVKGENLDQVTAISLDENSGIAVRDLEKAENPHYLFVNLDLKDASQGVASFTLQKGKKKLAGFDYQILERTTTRDTITNHDVIYLITPDRFANGDPQNDSVEGLKEKLNRSYYNGQHGGDLEGIISKLDYMEDLGVTTLWLNPVLENAMPELTYHGYAITDYYKVDPRYGNNELYKRLSKELSDRNMKLIMDMVFNHSGVEHWWVKDPPFSDWIHYLSEYKITNHAIASIPDPYAAESDRTLMEEAGLSQQCLISIMTTFTWKSISSRIVSGG